ncbi:FAD-dependent oxidoreductase [Aspergillus lucknowensis]|uniref:FAD-binding domain-containing protein n=1 Tax=Aspergillus lucknowensis TaxID=176173 RepID=A0ABR4LCU7_9EURO
MHSFNLSMKIIIIGGGISGCTAYLQLKKHLPVPPPGEQHEITIYEAYDTSIDATHNEGETHSSTLIVGGGLGVFPNGLHVLKRLDEDILRDVVRGGYLIAHQDLRSKNGTLLVRIDPTAHPEEDGERMHLLATSRHSLWKNLRLRIPDSDIQTKRILKVVATADGRNTVHFTDGSPSAEADLVIGADGVKGITKQAILPEKEDLYTPVYQGLVGVGGFISGEEVKDLVDEGSMNLVFGGNGFFGYFYSNSAQSAPNNDSPYHLSKPGDSLCWWSTYAVDECPDTKSLDMEAVAKQLRERHAHWKSPVIQKVLGSLEVKNMYPTWTSPQLPTWERDGVVLVGDAAHALPSTSGQGSSQALEDVEAFALLLSHSLRGVYQEPSPDPKSYKTAITTAAKDYMDIRRPRVQKILESAQRMQNSKRDMGVIAEYLMYCAMWIAGCFPRMMSSSLKGVINYNVAEEVKDFIERQK